MTYYSNFGFNLRDARMELDILALWELGAA